MFTVALFAMSKIRNEVCLSVDEWKRKKNAYITGYYSAIKKKNLALCNNMEWILKVLCCVK